MYLSRYLDQSQAPIRVTEGFLAIQGIHSARSFLKAASLRIVERDGPQDVTSEGRAEGE
jgi:hypothetical protein